MSSGRAGLVVNVVIVVALVLVAGLTYRTSGMPTGRPSGAPSGGPGGGAMLSDPKVQAALAACGITMPSRGAGPSGSAAG